MGNVGAYGDDPGNDLGNELGETIEKKLRLFE